MAARVFLTARWEHLVMLNYAIDPKILRPLIPVGTELDRWQGTAYVSVVGFLFLDAKVLGLPLPFHRNFEEINLRFYVRREVAGELRRGVVFIKEIVPRSAIAAVARLVYNENYVARPMRHAITLPDQTAIHARGDFAYGWREGRQWNELRVATNGAAQLLAADSAEAFITEHYWGYSRQRDGGTVEYQVEHPVWRVWTAHNAAFHCDVAAVYGAAFQECLAVPPRSAFVADGSAVIVRAGRRLGR